MRSETLAEPVPARRTSRLTLKPPGPQAGFVDGTWWPRTRDLTAELPPLMTALAGRLGRAERVAYNLAVWDSAPRRLAVDGQVVRLEGFRSQHPDTLTVLGAGGRNQLILLVIPPATEPVRAQHTLDTAAESGNIDSPETLLDAAGFAQPAGADSTTSAQERWEAEGGRLRRV